MAGFLEMYEKLDPRTDDERLCWAVLEMEKAGCLKIKKGKIMPTPKLKTILGQAAGDLFHPRRKLGVSARMILMEAIGLLSIESGVVRLTDAGEKNMSEHLMGLEARKDWATKSAEPPQLRRLNEADDAGAFAPFTTVSDASHSTAENLYFLIEPKDDGCRKAAAKFWGRTAGKTVNLSAMYCQGFVQGALQVWQEMEAQQ